jgi:D-alanyl-D-alanine dipeptidase
MYTINFIHLQGLRLLILLIIIYGCQNTDSKIDKNFETTHINSINTSNQSTKHIVHPVKLDTLEQKLIDAGLVDIQKVDSSIIVLLKYATNDNFMQTNVYGNLKKAYLQAEVAQSLSEAQQYLKSIDTSLSLLVYDAVRPRSVQQYMWDYLDLPVSEKTKFVSNPKNGSIHNYGSAVDLTIAKNDGTPLDMGAKYDEIERIAYPRLEGEFLASGELSIAQVQNRKLLRQVMKKAGFTGISTEWWHFNRYPRWKAKSLYEIIE